MSALAFKDERKVSISLGENKNPCLVRSQLPSNGPVLNFLRVGHFFNYLPPQPVEHARY